MRAFSILALVTVLMLVAAGPLRATDTAPLTLVAALEEALARNPELQAARARTTATGGRAHQDGLWPNPDLELSAEDMPADDASLSRSVNLIGLSQTVPFPGKKQLDRRIGRQELAAAEWEYRLREIELVRAVQSAFARALAAAGKVAVSEQLVELARALASAAGHRVAAGAAADQEQLRAEIELDRAATDLTAARRDEYEARRQLGRLLGRTRETAGPLAGELTESMPAAPPADAPDGWLARHPQVLAADARRRRTELELRRARLDPLPDITLGVASGRDEANNTSLMEFSVSVPLPLFDRGQGRRRATRALAEAAQHDRAAAEQQLLEQLNLTADRLRAARDQVDAYRTRILPKAEEALRLVRRGFEAGKFGFLDLVDTQRIAAEARLTYYDRLLDLNTALADWEALVGAQDSEDR